MKQVFALPCHGSIVLCREYGRNFVQETGANAFILEAAWEETSDALPASLRWWIISKMLCLCLPVPHPLRSLMWPVIFCFFSHLFR